MNLQTLICAKVRGFYRFTSVITHTGCWENARKLCKLLARSGWWVSLISDTLANSFLFNDLKRLHLVMKTKSYLINVSWFVCLCLYGIYIYIYTYATYITRSSDRFHIYIYIYIYMYIYVIVGNCSKCCWRVLSTHECRVKYSSKWLKWNTNDSL